MVHYMVKNNAGHRAVGMQLQQGSGCKPGNRCSMSSLSRNGHMVCKNFWYCPFMKLPMHFVLINKQKKRERERND